MLEGVERKEVVHEEKSWNARDPATLYEYDALPYQPQGASQFVKLRVYLR